MHRPGLKYQCTPRITGGGGAKGQRRHLHLLQHSLCLTLSLRFAQGLNAMAIMSSGLFSTFLAGDTASFAALSQSRFANSPSNLRMVRTVTSATVSQPPTGKQPRGIMRPRRISPEMQALVGVPEISRTQALKQIWAYIKENNLQVKCPFFFFILPFCPPIV